MLIAGGTGLVGKYLSQMLQATGHTVLHLSRKQDSGAKFPAYAWDLSKKTIDQAAADRADYIINLARRASPTSAGRRTQAPHHQQPGGQHAPPQGRHRAPPDPAQGVHFCLRRRLLRESGRPVDD
ncbi:MAG: NAD-dependent epimerase/dehydratase family protein [Saprospiraceae bacterium]|nr:NAD-dependent epimerase/dehydratase family protein [Saprospiraceae bacterium]